jgi:hypothetical protein
MDVVLLWFLGLFKCVKDKMNLLLVKAFIKFFVFLAKCLLNSLFFLANLTFVKLVALSKPTLKTIWLLHC